MYPATPHEVRKQAKAGQAAARREKQGLDKKSKYYRTIVTQECKHTRKAGCLGRHEQDMQASSTFPVSISCQNDAFQLPSSSRSECMWEVPTADMSNCCCNTRTILTPQEIQMRLQTKQIQRQAIYQNTPQNCTATLLNSAQRCSHSTHTASLLASRAPHYRQPPSMVGGHARQALQQKH